MPVAEPTDHGAVGHAIVLDADLRRALEAEAFTLHWQPYYDLASGAIVGQEALLRWNRPGHGPLSPAVFIPIAEASGLVADLDPWVLEHACRAATLWRLPQKVSVNISPYWFSTGDLPGLVEAVLLRTGLDAARLVIEMTERMVIEQPVLARSRIRELSRLGIKVALDDFGMGYAALSSLRMLPFDKLKLDRTLISDVGQEPRADAVARAIIQLAHGLGMSVVAEGVETELQLDVLRADDCDMVQGYLLGQPSARPQFWWIDAPAPSVQAIMR